MTPRPKNIAAWVLWTVFWMLVGVGLAALFKVVF